LSFDEPLSPSFFYTAVVQARPKASCSAIDVVSARARRRGFIQGTETSGSSHHSLFPREWLGPAAGLYNAGRQAGDGAPLRTHHGFFKLIQEHKATDMSLVPTMANALLNAPDLGNYNLSSVRNITWGWSRRLHPS